MADVTTQAAGAAAVGAGSFTVAALLGVEPQALIWAFVGAAAGLGATEPGGRWRALILFIPAVLGGALTGAAAGARWFDASPIVCNWIGMVAAGVFPVAVSWGLANIGRLLDGVTRKPGAGQ